MLDIQLIRRDPALVQERLARKGCHEDLSAFLAMDGERRSLIGDVEQMKAKRNRVSAEIPKLRKRGEDVTAVLVDMKELAERIKDGDQKLQDLEERCQRFLAALPNLPDDDLLPGGKENNQVLRVEGEKPVFAFTPAHHVDIAERLGLIDYVRGAKLAGSGYWIYKGLGAQLEWAILNYFMAEHLRDGYEMILPPHILNERCAFTAGQLPKFRDDLYWLERDSEAKEPSFLAPTAETALANLYRDEIVDETELPKKYFAYTPCYRKEAGSYRAEERGMIRGHQFNKIEMFQYTLPEQSDAAFEELVEKACRLVRGLGLHFRLSKLAAGDCSASMARTYDIEVWIPSMNDYKEVSSASNARDYQARRGNMRLRRADRSLDYMHTLNASGLATSRIFPAILEQFQEADGSVRIPEVLRAAMGGRTRLEVPEN